MRNIFVNEMQQIMREDSDVVFVSAECGFNVVEGLAAEFPHRYYNTGIAEQSMVGTVAGMALRGLKPVGYTMAMFLTMRAYEQIRVDVAYQNLPVVLAGVIPGYGYGNSGTTHHSIEDTAILRVLPNMTVVYTSCETDVRAMARLAVNYGKPIYIGLGRNNPNFDPGYSRSDVQIGKAIRFTDGKDAALFATGVMLPEAMEACKQLKEKGISISVYNMHTVKPLDVEAVKRAADECGVIYTLEEENILGGLGGAIAELIAESDDITCRFKRFGVPDTYGHGSGSIAWLRKQAGIDGASVGAGIEKHLKGQR